MTIVTGAITNVVLVLLLAPLFEGVIRKLKAFIQSRKGPPIIQPYIDIFKLLAKDDLQSGGGVIFRAAPVVSLAALLVAATLIPIGIAAPLGASGDILVWIYVISLAAVAVMLGAFASANPFAYAGAGREMMMLLSVEPVAITALLAGVVKARSLSIGGIMEWQLAQGPAISMAVAGVAFFLALQANVGRLPFDIVEAETEVASGPFIEYSGPRLALCKLAFYVRQLIFTLVFVSIFVPWPLAASYPAALLLTLAKALVVLILVGVIDSVVPRFRIDQSMTYMSRVFFVALFALAFAMIGA
jgi:formate hydrogenlyase subunit 4